MKLDLEEFEDGCCPTCGVELVDEETTQPCCSCCAERLERELAVYLEFVAVSREPAQPGRFSGSSARVGSAPCVLPSPRAHLLEEQP